MEDHSTAGTRTPEALVLGGSYAGLVAAAALTANRWNVRLVERSIVPDRTGGGVVIQPRMMDYLRSRGIGIRSIIGVPARTRKIFHADGTILRMPETAAAYTSWDILLRELERAVEPHRIERGLALNDILHGGVTGEVELSDGTTVKADLVVAADGIGSLARRLLLPGIEPTYAGYVAWRGMVRETEIPRKTVERFRDSFCSHSGRNTHMLLYEVPGENGSVEPGERRINWVWYENVTDQDELREILTDSSGAVHRSTVPRGMVPNATLTRMRGTAGSDLCREFATVIHSTGTPFVQTINDLLVPKLVFGRTVLIGDAASLIRPHIGSGTAKAVDDAIQLAHALSEANGNDPSCLAAWEHTRLDDHAGLLEYSRTRAQRLNLGSADSSGSTG